MTTLVLASIAVIAAATLVGVLWSIVGALRAESASSRLRRDGGRATGTVVDNTMTSTTQRRLLFSPVVEFRAMDGRQVHASAQQVAASSWARGATVEVAYDPGDPTRFVLAGAPPRGRLLANAIVGVLIVAIMAGTVVTMYRVWEQFHYDRGGEPAPVATTPGQPGSADGS